jgi:hypothetical protein
MVRAYHGPSTRPMFVIHLAIVSRVYSSNCVIVMLGLIQGLKNRNSTSFQNRQKPVGKQVKPTKNHFATVISFVFKIGLVLLKPAKTNRFLTVL